MTRERATGFELDCLTQVAFGACPVPVIDRPDAAHNGARLGALGVQNERARGGFARQRNELTRRARAVDAQDEVGATKGGPGGGEGFVVRDRLAEASDRILQRTFGAPVRQIPALQVFSTDVSEGAPMVTAIGNASSLTSDYAEVARRPLEAEQCALVVVDIQEKLLPPILRKEQLV